MIIHNRTSDTNRPQSRSTGHACIVPFNYAGQMNAIVKVLPRLPSELNMWQVVVTDKHKEFKMPINVEKIRVALDWLYKHNCLFKKLSTRDGYNEESRRRMQILTDLACITPRNMCTEKMDDQPQIVDPELLAGPSNADTIDIGTTQPGILDAVFVFLTHMVVFKI